MNSKTPKKRTNFMTNCCHVCKRPNPAVNCEICGLIFYCTPQHRIENWQQHSHLCRAVYKICQREKIDSVYEAAVGTSCEAFRNMRHKVTMDCIELLGRQLEPWELEMLYHPKMCSVCFKMPPTVLIPCKGCEYIFTCPKNHFNKEHSKWCGALKTYSDIVKFLHSNDIPKIPDVELSTTPTSMTDVLKQYSQLDDEETIENSTIHRVFVSEMATFPLTVLNGMKDRTQEEVTIHLVGAELQAEVLPFHKWETYLLHLLPSCNNLRLVCVGPDLKAIDESQLEMNASLCQKCQEKQRKLIFQLVPGTLYHDYLKGEDVEKPTLITTLNAGLYRSIGYKNTDSWPLTINAMFSEGMPPVLISEYTSHEIQKDKKLLTDRFPNLKFVEGPSVNPFASIRPCLNVISDDEIPVIFKNYYYMLVK